MKIASVVLALRGGSWRLALLLAGAGRQESPLDADAAARAMRTLYVEHRAHGQGPDTRAALFAFWSEHDGPLGEDPAYLLEKAQVLGWIDEDAEAARVFARVPDEALVAPLDLFNRLQTRVHEDLARVPPLLARLVRADPDRGARWVHECLAQALAPAPRPGLDLAAHVDLLEELALPGAPTAHVVEPLAEWARVVAGRAGSERLGELLRRVPRAGDEALTHGERYALLFAQRALQEGLPRAAVVASLEGSMQRLEALLAAKSTGADQESRARARYLLAHAAWTIAPLRATEAEVRAGLVRAAQAGPGADEQGLSASWFYEAATLGAPSDHLEPVARELERRGARAEASEMWIELALVHSERRAEARAAFERLTGRADFDARWRARFVERLPLVPELELRDLDGEPYTFATLRGRRLLLDFWGTWCGPCRAELPRIEALQREFEAAPEARASLLTIACGDTPETVAEFMARGGHAFPVVLADEALVRAFGITQWPTHVLVTEEGRWWKLDGEDWETVVRRELLGEER